MAIKFQYNKTSLGEMRKKLQMRQRALPTIKSKESALRSEVKKAKEAAQEFRSQLSRLEAEYDYMVSLSMRRSAWRRCSAGMNTCRRSGANSTPVC